MRHNFPTSILCTSCNDGTRRVFLRIADGNEENGIGIYNELSAVYDCQECESITYVTESNTEVLNEGHDYDDNTFSEQAHDEARYNDVIEDYGVFNFSGYRGF